MENASSSLPNANKAENFCSVPCASKFTIYMRKEGLTAKTFTVL